MNWELMEKLSNTPGLPGGEDKIRQILIDELKPLGAKIDIDALGNVIGAFDGAGPKLMLDAHTDEVGFIVNHIDENGFAHVVALGGVDGKVFGSQRLIVWGKEPLVGIVGSVPPHIASETSKNAVPVEESFIDFGLSAEKVKSIISVGDLVSFDTKCHQTEESFIGKAFDDRCGIFVMIEAIKAAKVRNCKLFAVGAIQEEIGLRGASAAATAIMPDLALSLEGTVAADVPGTPAFKKMASVGAGAEIRLCDGRFVADRKWSFFISELAKSRNIPHQIVVKRAGGTNAAAVQVSGVGVRTTALSLPVRYIHSPQGIVKKSDIESAVALTAAVIEEAGNFDKSF
jgi:tetrahedral aminopeptidase